MEFQKSERNQQIYEQRKLESKQKGRIRPKMSAPRFAPYVVIPEVPEGMELQKFYGKPVLLPIMLEGEPMVGKSPYTRRQMDILEGLALVIERQARENNAV